MLTASPRRFQRGFTLVELMTAVVVLGVLLTLGLPAMQTFIQNAKFRGTAESIQNGLQLARNEAARRNARVQFQLSADGAWTVRAVDATGAALETIQQRSKGEGSDGVALTLTPTTVSSITFTAFGRPAAQFADNTAIVNLTRIDIANADATKQFRIDISSAGQVRMCDPAITATDDPRKC